MKKGASESKLTRKITVISLFAILILSGPSAMMPVLADPPLPDPGPIIPKVFCLRIMDINQINANTFDIEFEFLNWSNVPVHSIEFDITNPNLGNVVFSGSSIDSDGRPLVFVDVDGDTNFPPGDLDDFEDANNDGVMQQGEDKNGNNRFDNDEAPGNLNTPNNWTLGTETQTEVTFLAGTPIPPIDLLNAPTTAAANALVPFMPVDPNGNPLNPEDVDNGINVLDGFVIRVTDLDDTETFSMNWFAYDVSGNPVGTPQAGNSFGFGMITLGYLELAGPNPNSPFVGLPSLAQNPEDFYDNVFNVNPTFFTGVLPARLGAAAGIGAPILMPPGLCTWCFTAGGNGHQCDGPVYFFNPTFGGGNIDHLIFLINDAIIKIGLLRTTGPTGPPLQQGFPQSGSTWTGALQGTGEINPLNPDECEIHLSASGAGPLTSDVNVDGFVNMNGGLSTAQTRFSGGFIPGSPPDNEITFNQQTQPQPFITSAEAIPVPDTLPVFKDGNGIRVEFSNPMVQKFISNFNSDFGAFDNAVFTEVNVGTGLVSHTWVDDQTVDLIFQDTTGHNIPDNPGNLLIHPDPGTTLVGVNGQPLNLFFDSGALTNVWGNPSLTPACDVTYTFDDDTFIDASCLMAPNEKPGGDVYVTNGANVESHGPFCPNLTDNKLVIENGASWHNMGPFAAIIDTSAFATCP